MVLAQRKIAIKFTYIYAITCIKNNFVYF